MEVTSGRGGTLPVPSSSSQPPRKEWRAVSDPEHLKLGQSDERTINDEGAGPVGVDFCSIAIDGGGVSDEMLQQRLQEVSRRREGLQHVEIELRAQAIARSGLLDMQSSFQSQIKEHADAASQLKEQLHDREQHMRELEMDLEEKDRELRAIKIDHEAAWAKDDLLREQNKELVTFRRERDNSEAERAQHLKQIHDLQEHIQEKESQFFALEEQHRVAQKTILYKDEQLREAQTWITRAQEVDALHSTTNQQLQAEIRERAEQFTQYYFGLQRQYAEVERHHLQTIQQLQLELAETREQNGTHKDGPNVTRENSADSSSHAQTKSNQINVNDVGSNGNLGFISNGTLDGHASFVTSSNPPAKTEHPAGVAVVPSPALGIGSFFPPSHMTAMHPFVMHPQGVPQAVSSSNSHIPQSHIGHFQPMSTIAAHHHWQNQQAVADISQSSNQNNYQPSQTDQNLVRPDAHYSYELPAERKIVHEDHLNIQSNQQPRSGPLINGSAKEVQLLESNGKQYQVAQAPQEASQANASFHSTIVYSPPKQNSEIKVQDKNTISAIAQSQDEVLSGQQWSDTNVITSAAPVHSVNSSSVLECNDKTVVYPESATRISSMVQGKTTEPMLLDERSLLACIVRAIPAGADGRIRISTTLPNRLGKMLAPLHWHDYKKRYGKLDEFVAHHPELFVVEGDFIHLREGAQEIISATTAFAKVAAAAAASSAPYSSLFPSVALTPVAQSNRLKRIPSVDSKATNTVSFSEGAAVSHPGDSFDRSSQIPKSYNQQPNRVNFNIVKGLSDVNISTKSKNHQEPNGISSEVRPANSALHNTVGIGANKGLSNGRLVSVGKQQARSTGAGIISRR
ncbi:uncharacterized protein M6B38_372790 [Iris pallida]|uniref:DUF7725 domain-containing protein n=1 Tax=Iris pallida TaxID=29817 RepID=A0AAX6GDG0_IRIPA|nr:uncharacterized protein M6B38_372790 [Iris pallida]